jgi:amidohydrolase
MEPGVVTFGTIHGGRANNVIADSVKLHGTLRYFRDDVREQLKRAVTGAFKALEAQGANVDVTFGPSYLPVVNDTGVTEVVRQAALELAGRDAVVPMERWMGAEDFAFLARKAPGCFVWVGAALPEPREHHHPRFDIDESVLPLDAALLAASAVALLEERGR